MNRPIKFRAKGKSDGQWHYGSLLQIGDDLSIATDTEAVYEMCDVAPSTIGQFTGLLDCNGKEIYEGDIVRLFDFKNCQVVFERGAFCYMINNHIIPFSSNIYLRIGKNGGYREVEILGNIHDNPELIEKIE